MPDCLSNIEAPAAGPRARPTLRTLGAAFYDRNRCLVQSSLGGSVVSPERRRHGFLGTILITAGRPCAAGVTASSDLAVMPTDPSSRRSAAAGRVVDPERHTGQRLTVEFLQTPHWMARARRRAGVVPAQLPGRPAAYRRKSREIRAAGTALYENCRSAFRCDGTRDGAVGQESTGLWPCLRQDGRIDRLVERMDARA